MRASIILGVIGAFAFCTLFPGHALAERATPEEMERVCQNWLAYMIHERGSWADDPNPVITSVDELYADDLLVARVFSIYPRGYIVVPVLKELPPVKMYSETSEFDVDAEGGVPALLRDVLSHRFGLYVEAYGSLDAIQPAKGDVVFGRAHYQEWDRLLVTPEQFHLELDQGTKAFKAEVGPLLSTSWRQGSPYHDLCPQGYELEKCRAGCVAIATAQVMNYHEWPPSGVGTHSYDWDGDDSCEGGTTGGYELSADFSDDYDWANMPNDCQDGCSDDEEWALAELCYEVGVALEMDYGVCVSEIPTRTAENALEEFFRYDDSIQEKGRSGTQQEWFNLIKDEINADRPMIYRILGHAIVCDGWRDDGGYWYHINYGWGGDHTGWFRIDGIYDTENPTANEYLLRYIIPETPVDTIYVDCTTTADLQDGTADHPCRYIWKGLEKAQRRGASYVSVAPGGYTGAFEIPEGITVLGAGSTLTTFHMNHSQTPIRLWGNTGLSGFTIDDPGDLAIDVTILNAAQTVHISDVVIERAKFGIHVFGPGEQSPAGTIEHCVIWSHPYPPPDLCCYGISVQDCGIEIANNTVDGYCNGIRLYNATANVVDNLVTGCESGIFCESSTLTENHNGFWDNETDISGGCGGKSTAGEGDLYYKPLYVDRGNHDYRLRAGSPYIDAGSAAGIDIGALEFVPSEMVSAPTGLGAEVWGEDGEVRFYWDHAADAWSYLVYYGLASEPDIYDGTDADVAESPFAWGDTSVVLTLSESIQYQLDVTTVDSQGDESSFTFGDCGTITPADLIPPAHPTEMAAAPGDRRIILSWTNPTTGDWYRTMIRRSTSTYPTQWDQGDSVYCGRCSTRVDFGLSNGTKYYYTAFARDEVPNWTDGICASCTTSAIPVDLIAPDHPVFVSADPGDRHVDLEWTNPSDIDWVATRIVRQEGSYPNDHEDGTIVCEGDTTAVTDTGLENVTGYFYGAFARDDVDNWSPVAEEALIYAFTGDDADPVWLDGDGLDSLAVRPWTTTGEVRLFWNAATDSSSMPVFYNVYYDSLYPAENGTKLEHVAYGSCSGSQDFCYTVDALKYGRTYYFLVRAEDNLGNETDDTDETRQWSATLEYTTRGTFPGMGTRFTLGDLVDDSYGAVEAGVNPDTYCMFGNLTISAYDTLVMSAGETLTSTDVTGDKKLRILGAMEADGVPGPGYVTLTGIGSTSETRWGGLELQNPTASSHLDATIIEKTRWGVRWSGGDPHLEDCIIRYVSSAGLEASCDYGGAINVMGTEVHDCVGDGMECDGPGPSSVMIENCTVHGAGGTGIQVWCGSNGGLGVVGNTVGDCGWKGMDCVADSLCMVAVEDNEVFRSGGGGIVLDLEAGANGTITANTVYENLSGISFAYTDPPPAGFSNSLVVDMNSVYDNTGEGFSVGKTNSQTQIWYNETTGNDIGIDFIEEMPDTAGPYIFMNSVTGNTTGIRCGMGAIPRIDSCFVANNEGPGILSIDWGNPTVTRSTITGNLVGVRVDTDQGPGWIDLGKAGDGNPWNDGRNRIYDNTNYDAEILIAYPLVTVPGEMNWWGDQATQEMWDCGFLTPCNISTIWDGWDVAGLTKLDYVIALPSSGSGTAPTITVTSPGPGGAAVDSSFTITWNDADPDQDATVGLYYEDTSSGMRRPIPGASSLSEDDPQDSFLWNTAATDTGTFFIYGLISDGWASDSSSSQGTVTIGHPFVDVDTTGMAATLRPDSTRSLPLTLRSVGSYALGFQLSDRDSSGVDLLWADQDPSLGSISPGDSAVVRISLEAAGLATGVYEGEVLIASGDPWRPEIAIELELTVKAPDIVLSDAAHDFGAGSVGDTLSWALFASNAGDDTLNLYSTTCASADYWVEPPIPGGTVAPGQLAILPVRFCPSEVGDRSDTLWIHSDDPDSGFLGVPLAGTGMDRLALSTSSLDFGEVAIFHCGTESLWVANGDTISFSLVGASVGGQPFAVQGPGMPRALAPGESVAVSVSFCGTLTGSYPDMLTLTTDHVPPMQAQVSLLGDATHPAISLSTTELDFGMVALGDTGKADCWARSVGIGSLDLENWQTSDARFGVDEPIFPVTVPAGDSTLVRVWFAPPDPDAVSSTLTLSSNDPFHSTLDLSLAGSGPLPDIHVTQIYSHWGEAVAAVDTVLGDITIVNRGIANLEVLDLSITSEAFTLLTGTPFTVLPEDTADVDLLFHPASESLYVEGLSIASNDPDASEDTLTVVLFGDGVIPVLALSADSLIAEAFEDGASGETLFVHNEGSGTLYFQAAKAGADTSWFDITPDSDGVPAGDSTAIAVTFDPQPVGHGVHHGTLFFSSNDPAGGTPEATLILRVPRMHYADLDTGNVCLTVTDEGVLGYIDMGQISEYGEGIYGSGFHFPVDDPENRLFDGSVWLGVDSSYVADASYDYDWEVIPGGALTLTHENGRQVARASWNDANGAAPLGLTLHLTASAAPDSPDDEYVVVEITIENTTGNTVEGLHAGIYMDWDTGAPRRNVGGYWPEEALGYLHDRLDSTYVGMTPLRPLHPGSFRLIHNPTQVWPYSEVRDEDAFAFMSSGLVDSSTFEAADWSMVVAHGPFTLAPAESELFTVAILAGEDFAGIRTNAHQARTITSVASTEGFLTTRYHLGPPRPNPFNPVVSFDLLVPEPGGEVRVDVYDVRGRLVRRIFGGTAAPGPHLLVWEGRDDNGCPVATGVYFVRMVAGDRVQVRKAVLLK